MTGRFNRPHTNQTDKPTRKQHADLGLALANDAGLEVDAAARLQLQHGPVGAVGAVKGLLVTQLLLLLDRVACGLQASPVRSADSGEAFTWVRTPRPRCGSNTMQRSALCASRS